MWIISASGWLFTKKFSNYTIRRPAAIFTPPSTSESSILHTPSKLQVLLAYSVTGTVCYIDREISKDPYLKQKIRQTAFTVIRNVRQ